MPDLKTDLAQFAADNRWTFYPIVGAVMFVIVGVPKMGVDRLRRSNHPIQAIVALAVFGALAGLFMAWVTRELFH